MMSLSERVLSGNFLFLPNTIVLFMTGVFLSSCATNMSEGYRMRRDDTLIGGSIGAIGGYVVSKDKNKAAGTAIGTAAGLATGYIIGDQGAKRIERTDHGSIYREQLACNIQQEIAEIADYNYDLRRQVDRYERDINNNIDRRRSAKEALRTAKNEYKKWVSILVQARQKSAQMYSQNHADAERLRLLEEHIRDLDLSIRRLKKIIGGYRLGGGWN